MSYTLRRRRGMRRIRVTVSCEGVTVIAPRSYPIWSIEFFLRKKAGWIRETLAQFQSRPRLSSSVRKQDFDVHRESARCFVLERLTQLNQYYGFTYGRVSIRHQKTRWGSCSRTGNLSFNYRIVKLPSELADYIIVHELCHLQEMNHSPRFWRLVEETIPHHRALRQRLRAVFL